MPFDNNILPCQNFVRLDICCHNKSKEIYLEDAFLIILNTVLDLNCYLFFLNNLIFLLVDSRHLPTSDDLMMLEWIEHYNIDYYVIATKTDKLKPSQRQKQIDDILECLNIDESRFITFSAENGENKASVFSCTTSAH